MGGPDYYHILQVSRGAGLEEIKRAYRKLAAQYHPDLHPDDPDAETRLRTLNQAYETLRDPLLRAKFDRWGAWGPPTWPRADSRGTGEWIAALVTRLIHAYEALEAHKPQRGADLRYTLSLPWEAGQQGTEARIRVPNSRWCPRCQGSRMAGGKPPCPCPQCRGAGELSRAGRWLRSGHVCEVCQGEGEVVTDPCQRCNGQGSLQVERILTICVPAGVREESRLRVRGEGGTGRWGGPPGDLFVYIRFTSQPKAPTSA
ncbi:MAG: DnaJ domain-containing protein [Nitrospinae bacterium]|nr:DnaJ domain-containing protein [Nitrospinota bacterium]